MMLYGQWIDFVNLRSESYDVDSRIPDKVVCGPARWCRICSTHYRQLMQDQPTQAFGAEAEVGVWDAGAGCPAAGHYNQCAVLQPHDGPSGRLHQDGRLPELR